VAGVERVRPLGRNFQEVSATILGMEATTEDQQPCPRCGRGLISCFAGTYEGSPARARYYCQHDRLSVVVLAEGAEILLPDPAIPVEIRSHRIRALAHRFGGPWLKASKRDERG
jgi:hypothetical protein